ncbi:MAG: hypothetical protein RLZZ520_1075 [Bacteroidota bacterium]|jgi:hypothetical protein
MKLLSTIAVLLLFIAAVPNKDGVPAKKGWKSLFDGKTTKGWHIYRGEATGESWQVENGLLTFTPVNKPGVKTGGDLTTDEEYENYHLSVEWKISEGGNSGIIFGVKEDSMFKKSYLTGMEMQVLDNSKHPDAKIIKHRAGDLYDLISCSKETVKPAGEWNHAEVIYNNNNLQLILNGETVVSTVVGDENWNKLVAGSKFKTMKGFGTFRKGRIVLQDHGDKVWYRDIKIKEL